MIPRSIPAAMLGAFVLLALPASSWSQAKGSPEHIRAVTARIDTQGIRDNARATQDWPSYGLDHGETRFSRLKQLDTGNVKNLGLAWSYDLESTRGVEATP
ncbi:MAG: PQQ-dependent dehydrogenase, methanol/ethanol family, partial [Acidovorax defluvii]